MPDFIPGLPAACLSLAAAFAFATAFAFAAARLGAAGRGEAACFGLATVPAGFDCDPALPFLLALAVLATFVTVRASPECGMSERSTRAKPPMVAACKVKRDVLVFGPRSVARRLMDTPFSVRSSSGRGKVYPPQGPLAGTEKINLVQDAATIVPTREMRFEALEGRILSRSGDLADPLVGSHLVLVIGIQPTQTGPISREGAMPDFKQSMTLFHRLGAKQHVAQNLLIDLLDAQGVVRFLDIEAFHDAITDRRHGFVLRDNSPKFVRPGGRQLFYVNGPILVRVKTTGTDRRPEPHMTVSLSEDLSWPGEAAKFNRQGDIVPRISPISTAAAQGQWRALLRVGDTAAQIEASDDAWANSCHFNFPAGFDGSAAPTLVAIPS
jgi:hypothetical protein